MESRKPLLNILKVQVLTNEPDGFVVYFTRNQVHRYWCSERDKVVAAIESTLKETLGHQDMHVEKTDGTWEYDALRGTCLPPLPLSSFFPFFLPSLCLSFKGRRPSQRLPHHPHPHTRDSCT